MGRLVILGIGNPYRGDDGVGLVVARSLRDKVPQDVVVLEQGGEPATLIEAWADADAVFLIDAVSSGAQPGSLHVIDATRTPLSRDLFRHSTHSFGVAEAVELARTLGKLPSALWIYGIEGKNFGTGLDLSPQVAEAADKAADAVLDKIRELESPPAR